jgi:hypothetical protein
MTFGTLISTVTFARSYRTIHRYQDARHTVPVAFKAIERSCFGNILDDSEAILATQRPSIGIIYIISFY